jgi:hypothetical protein
MAANAEILNKVELRKVRAWHPIVVDVELSDDTGGGNFGIDFTMGSDDYPSITPVAVAMTTHGTISGDSITDIFIPTDTKRVSVHVELDLQEILEGEHTNLWIAVTPSEDDTPSTETDRVTILWGNDVDPSGVYDKYKCWKGAVRVYFNERLLGFLMDENTEVTPNMEVDPQKSGSQSGPVAFFAKANGYQIKLSLQQYMNENLAMAMNIDSANLTYNGTIQLPGGGVGDGEILELVPNDTFLEEGSLRLVGYAKRADKKDAMWWFPAVSVIASAPIIFSQTAVTGIGVTFGAVQNPQTLSFGEHVIGNLR